MSARDTTRGRSGTHGRSDGGECDGFVAVEEGGGAGVEEADEVSCHDWGVVSERMGGKSRHIRPPSEYPVRLNLATCFPCASSSRTFSSSYALSAGGGE